MNKPIKCRKCGETCLTLSEKAYGEHWSIVRCSNAIARSINRTLARAELYSEKLQHVLVLLDEIKADVEQIEQAALGSEA